MIRFLRLFVVCLLSGISVNSSGSDSHLQLFTMNTSFPLKLNCFISKPSSTINNAFNIINILLIFPLCILILCYCLQKWWQKHSTSSAATISHSDLFTYHMVIIELIGVLGCILTCCGSYRYYTDSLFSVGNLLSSFTWTAQMFFHILTCLERYLAIVHPITYLSLRNERGIKMRNISIGCVWLLLFCRDVFGDDKKHIPCGFLHLGLLFSRHLLLQHFRSLCFDTSRPRRPG